MKPVVVMSGNPTGSVASLYMAASDTSSQRWKTVVAVAALPVLIFYICANVCFFTQHFLMDFAFFGAIFGLFCFFLQDFECFLHIFCELIFQTQSFASAIL